MALIACPDCNAQISDAAPTCPQCGRPNAPARNPADLCPRCNHYALRTGTGLHGGAEIFSGILLTAACLFPGIAYYFYVSKDPWCANCHRRPPGVGASPAAMILLAVGVAALAYVFWYGTPF